MQTRSLRSSSARRALRATALFELIEQIPKSPSGKILRRLLRGSARRRAPLAKSWRRGGGTRSGDLDAAARLPGLTQRLEDASRARAITPLLAIEPTPDGEQRKPVGGVGLLVAGTASSAGA